MMGWFSSKEDDDAYRRAALEVVCDDLGVGSVWPGDSEHEINVMQAAIDRANVWIATVPDGKARLAYSGWIKFYQSRVNEARSELTTHKHRDRAAAYDAECRAREANAAAIAPALPRPTRAEIKQ